MNERELYFGTKKINFIYKKLTKHPDYIFYKAVVVHRKYKHYKEVNNKIMKLIYSYKANHISSKYNLELYGSFSKNLRIWHGNIIINGKAKLGKNVQLHGNNCIGEKNGMVPVIGDNVEIGYGAVIIGDVKIEDDCIIGANSIITKSIPKGSIVAGNPAKFIK